MKLKRGGGEKRDRREIKTSVNVTEGEKGG